ncbi:MAG TPA: hypothetical protein VI837_06680, partial [Blastocatellia bacterium]|nr:hypothetical protein [Blastocatellia bacterium]
MNAKMILGMIVVVVSIASSSYAQEFTLTTTPANTVSSKASIDMPGLTGNPMAIIVATPAGGTLNPHPIGAWYYSGKWNIFNTDHAVMPLGAKYRVQFFTQPGPNQFVHLISQQNLGSEGSYIDHPALNNNPNAQVQIFQNHSPDVRPGSALNSFEVRAAYGTAAGRWYITNVNNELLRRGGAYNVVISSGSSANVGAPSETSPTNQPVQSVPKVTTPSKPSPVIQPLQPVTNVNLQATPVSPAPVSATPSPAAPVNTTPKLYGFVDMHTHPVSQLGFGEQLFFGDNDGDPNIALGSCNCVHNFLVPPFSGSCGSQNLYRNKMVDSIDTANLIASAHLKVAGFPNFDQWPKYNSILHQQMWIDWIKRAKEGGLRVMVAL